MDFPLVEPLLGGAFSPALHYSPVLPLPKRSVY